MPKFKTTLLQAEGMNATGIEVPPEIVDKLGQGKRPKVVLTLKGHTYRTTVAVMGGKYMVGVPKEHREAIGAKGGDRIEVLLELDAAPREVEVPEDLAAALKRAKVREAFDKLSFTTARSMSAPSTKPKRPKRASDGSTNASRYSRRGSARGSDAYSAAFIVPGAGAGASGVQRRRGDLAARVSSRRLTGARCGAVFSDGSFWVARRATEPSASAKRSSSALLSVSVGSISMAPWTTSGK